MSLFAVRSCSNARRISPVVPVGLAGRVAARVTTGTGDDDVRSARRGFLDAYGLSADHHASATAAPLVRLRLHGDPPFTVVHG